MSQEINRPKASTKKIHSKNEFELCYLRHQYLRKTKYNPTEEEMRPYEAIAIHMAKNTFFMYKNLFGMVGFELEDIVNIGKIHLISFLGLFSLDKMPGKYDEFIEKHEINQGATPSEDQVMGKNKANCTLFLKQRMEDLVRVCRQKARNIKGLPTEEFFFYFGTKRPPAILRDLIDKHEKLGYKKLDTSIYKSIRKKVKMDDSPVFKFNGFYYVAVPVEQKCLSLSDFSGAGLDPYDSIHNMNPEEIYFSIEESTDWEKKQAEFDSKDPFSKTKIIKKFLRKNQKNPRYKEEIRLARKLLKTLENANA